MLMIIFFDGTPGSGKSYEAVKKIVDNLRMGRKVYTNIEGMNDPKCIEAIKAIYNIGDYDIFNNLAFLEDEKIKNFWEHVDEGALIVIDEAHKFFNVRDWQSEKNNKFAVWASTHRHHGYDVVLVTVDISRVDTSVRQLTEWTYRFKKANFFGSLVQKKYMCFAYVGDDKDGKPLSNSVRTYDAKIFHCYKSYVTKDIKELGIMKHANILRHPVFYAIPVVIGLFIYLFFRSGAIKGDIFGADKMLHKAKAQVKSVVIPVGSRQGQLPESRSVPGQVPGPVKRVNHVPVNGVQAQRVTPVVQAAPVKDSMIKKDVPVLVGMMDGKKVYRKGGAYYTGD